jgi:hypothetical protein
MQNRNEDRHDETGRRLGTTASRSARATEPLSNDFLDYTIAFWQPRLNRELTHEDARQIAENLVGFFKVLQDWDREERTATARVASGKRNKL